MIAVIFEVEPHQGRSEDYFSFAAELKPLLAGIDGFISIERFQSLAEPARFLSLSFLRDEEAVRAWRNHGEHRAVQQAGRSYIFRSYRLRVAQVVRDYGLDARDQAPADSNTADKSVEINQSK